MANRFERLFQLPEKQYIEGSPVILAAGVLSKDTETGSVIAQLKFQSVSEKRIKAVKVSLSAYDVSKAEVQGVTDYQYLELNVGNGQDFGANKAIVMPTSVTRSFTVSSILVVFGDGSMWDSNNDFAVLPAAKALSLGSAELNKQYRIATNDSASYTPAENQDLWQCACGTWNKGAICTHCRILKNKVFSALDVTTLTEQMNIRLTKEQEQREAEAARQAQLQAEAEIRRKKNKKRLTIFTIIALTVAILLTTGIAIYNKITELTIEKLLCLYTQEDVKSLLGKPDNAEYNSYDVKFMGEKFYLAFDYDGEELNDFSLVYRYPGADDLETAGELLNYKITSNDRKAANRILDKVISSFKEKYGDPKIFNSEVDTTTYTWVINDRMIELYDYTDNDDMGSMFGAFSVDVNCDHQSFCEHTDTKAEHKEATCIEDGYDRTICTLCGYVDETIHDALGHSNNATVTKEATCVECGEQYVVCSICNFSENESIPALGHKYEQSAINEVTCTTDGVKYMKCARCSDSYSENIPALGHDWKEATCTKPKCCGNCGQTEGKALGHDLQKTDSRSANCTTDGYTRYTCKTCGEKVTENIPATGHNFEKRGHSDPTCVQYGYTSYICTKCSYENYVSIDPTGHSYEDGSCVDCGATQPWW